MKYLINNYSPNDNKNGKKKTKKHRFYYQSLEEKCVLNPVFSVNIHFQCHLKLIPLWKNLQLFTLSSSYFVNISFVQEGPCARARINLFFSFPKVAQLFSNLFINVVDNNGEFFSLSFKDVTTFIRSN